MATEAEDTMDEIIKEFKQQPLKFAARPKEITIEQLFPTGNYLNIRVGMTWSVGDENPTDVMKAAMDLANNFHRQNFPLLYDKEGKPKFNNYTGEEPVIQNDKKLTGFAHWENEINKCTTIEKPDGIEAFRTISDMNPKLKEVFDNKLNELKNKID
jgi:hypothetical protein